MTAGNRRCSGKKIWGNKSRGPLELVPPCQLRTSEATDRGSNYPRSQAQASRRRRRRRTNVPHVSVGGAPRPPLAIFISNHQQHTIHPFCIATVSTGSALPYDGHAAAVTVPFPSSSYSRHRRRRSIGPLHRCTEASRHCPAVALLVYVAIAFFLPDTSSALKSQTHTFHHGGRFM